MESPASGSMRGPAPAAPNAGVLPTEVLFDILLRLPAKELCRLHAVCRSWRALTSDPLFIGAHAARHPDPLFLVNFSGDRTQIHVVDLSGSVLKRIPIADGHLLLPTSLDLACAATTSNSCHVIDPATGSVCVLPVSPAAEHAGQENLLVPNTSFAFGRIAATGEYKVLRMFSRQSLAGDHQQNLFEVFTINSGSGPSQPQWRATQSHDSFVKLSSAIVVGKVVYFKIDITYNALIVSFRHHIRLGRIIPFDLEKEEWRKSFRGPSSNSFQTEEYDDGLEEYIVQFTETTLADLRGSLVPVHYRRSRHIMDLWLLKDVDNVLWVKEYTIQIEPIVPTTKVCVKSLFMIDYGRLVIHFPKSGLLLIYDPRTDTSTRVEMRHLDAVAMYTGNLLSSQA